jgi:aromatic-amino-acid transaminase
MNASYSFRDLFALNSQARLSSHRENLGIGIYYDEKGRIPLLAAVREADLRVRARNRLWSYLPAEALPSLKEAALPIVFGEQAADDLGRRTAWIQTVGGTGAVRVGAELVKALAPGATASISDPSWPNHEAIFRSVGLMLTSYRYHEPTSGLFDVEGMLEDIERLPTESIVVLHGCCHNPTGIDPTETQWKQIANMLARRGLVPFLDLAYQGFGQGLDLYAQPVRLIAGLCNQVFVSVSFSKSFSLYGERVALLGPR